MTAVKTVLIYRLGSLGDSVVAMPAFHLIDRAYPNAKKYVLTNCVENGRESHISAVIGGTGIVDGFISYPIGLRGPKRLYELRARIKRLRPDILIYLAAARGRAKAIRDAIFFSCCGVKKIIGVPFTKDLQQNRVLGAGSLFEPEAERLARCISVLGNACLDDWHSWNIELSDKELGDAQDRLQKLGTGTRFIACSVGAKVDTKNWGLENWQVLLGKIYAVFGDFALLLIGGKEDFTLSELAARRWHGKKVNFCGTLSPRESTAILKYSEIFLGHDSGPMHLAASVGTPCVAVFSARNKPGTWFPAGDGHRVIYHRTECFGCQLDSCDIEAMRCIKTIGPGEVMKCVQELLC